MGYLNDKEQQLFQKLHYQKNKAKYRAQQVARRRQRARWFWEYKKKCKCSRCPERHPACLEFHHKDPKTKTRIISDMIHEAHSVERILEEIAKCEVWCSNCHQKHHWRQRQKDGTSKIKTKYRRQTAP